GHHEIYRCASREVEDQRTLDADKNFQKCPGHGWSLASRARQAVTASGIESDLVCGTEPRLLRTSDRTTSTNPATLSKIACIGPASSPMPSPKNGSAARTRHARPPNVRTCFFGSPAT